MKALKPSTYTFSLQSFLYSFFFPSFQNPSNLSLSFLLLAFILFPFIFTDSVTKSIMTLLSMQKWLQAQVANWMRKSMRKRIVHKNLIAKFVTTKCLTEQDIAINVTLVF